MVVDYRYVGSVDQLEFVGGGPEAIASFNGASIPAAVVTNQTWVARCVYRLDDIAHVCIGTSKRVGRLGRASACFCPSQAKAIEFRSAPMWIRHKPYKSIGLFMLAISAALVAVVLSEAQAPGDGQAPHE